MQKFYDNDFWIYLIFVNYFLSEQTDATVIVALNSCVRPFERRVLALNSRITLLRLRFFKKRMVFQFFVQLKFILFKIYFCINSTEI